MFIKFEYHIEYLRKILIKDSIEETSKYNVEKCSKIP